MSIAKRGYIVAADPLGSEQIMVRPDIPTGAEGTFEGKRVMAYSSEEAAELFKRGEDGFPEAPWPQTVTLTRPRGTSEPRIANEPGLESETGGWEYHDYRRIDAGVIILMDERRYFSDRVIQDANVVIDKDGAIIKHRQAPVTSEPMSAGPELLEQAEPVFPERVRGKHADCVVYDEARRFSPPENGFDVSTSVVSNSSPLALSLATLSLALSVAAICLAVWG